MKTAQAENVVGVFASDESARAAVGFLSDPVALALGLIGLVVAGAAIGAVVGRSRVFVAEHGSRYEDAVVAGRVLVAVHVKDGEHDRARRLLREAGAVRIREECTIEAA